MLLGDLYLWKGDYEKAASMYHEMIYKNSLIISKNYESSWVFEKNIPNKTDWLSTFKWETLFTPSSTETVSALASSPDYGSPFTLDSLSYHSLIEPTAVAFKNWNDQLYFYSDYAVTQGDNRGYGSYLCQYSLLKTQLTKIDKPIITKFINMGTESEKRIILYRNSLAYLRYAEAVNRLGYPQLAFAVIKYGLNQRTLNYGSSAQTKPYGTIYQEIGLNKGSIPEYLDFRDYRFTNNVGIRTRGLGNVNMDSTNYVIQSLPHKEDSILFVEDKIVEELALETAFEGNRFHDLMRIAIRRGNPSYLADKVAAKYGTNSTLMRTILMDTSNWYLP